MNQFIQTIRQKTGLSEDKAKEVVELVSGHSQSHLPAPPSSAVAKLIDESTDTAGSAAEGPSARGSGLRITVKDLTRSFLRDERQ